MKPAELPDGSNLHELRTRPSRTQLIVYLLKHTNMSWIADTAADFQFDGKFTAGLCLSASSAQPFSSSYIVWSNKLILKSSKKFSLNLPRYPPVNSLVRSLYYQPQIFKLSCFWRHLCDQYFCNVATTKSGSRTMSREGLDSLKFALSFSIFILYCSAIYFKFEGDLDQYKFLCYKWAVLCLRE